MNIQKINFGLYPKTSFGKVSDFIDSKEYQESDIAEYIKLGSDTNYHEVRRATISPSRKAFNDRLFRLDAPSKKISPVNERAILELPDEYLASIQPEYLSKVLLDKENEYTIKTRVKAIPVEFTPEEFEAIMSYDFNHQIFHKWLVADYESNEEAKAIRKYLHEPIIQA